MIPRTGAVPIDLHAVAAVAAHYAGLASWAVPVVLLVLLILYRHAIKREMEIGAQTNGAFDVHIGAANGRVLPIRHRGNRAQAQHEHRKALRIEFVLAASFVALSGMIVYVSASSGHAPWRYGFLVLMMFWPLTWRWYQRFPMHRQAFWWIQAACAAGLLAMCLRQLVLGTPALPVPLELFVPPWAPSNLQRVVVELPGALQPLLVWAGLTAPWIVYVLLLLRPFRSLAASALIALWVSGWAALLVVLLADSMLGAELLTGTFVRMGVPADRIPLTLMVMVAVAIMLLLAVVLQTRIGEAAGQWLADERAIWLVQLLVVVAWVLREPYMAPWLVGPVAVLATYFYFTARPYAHRPAISRDLLFLRVFPQSVQTENNLLGDLASQWRRRGRTVLAGAPDAASITANPARIIDYLAGRLRLRFCRTREQVDQRMAELANGLWAHSTAPYDVLCSGPVWRYAVERLLEGKPWVVMDLRGFSASNDGCKLEFTLLLRLAELEAVRFLIDHRTDKSQLRMALNQAAGLAGAGADLHLFFVEDRGDRAATLAALTT